jgi:hypothetical protein
VKIWRNYGSAHSAHLSVVASFKKVEDAKLAREVMDDFLRYVWLEADKLKPADFYKVWEQRLHGVQFLGPSVNDFEMGIDNGFDIALKGETVEVSGIRSAEIGGIVKILLLAGSEDVRVLGQTGP